MRRYTLGFVLGCGVLAAACGGEVASAPAKVQSGTTQLKGKTVGYVVRDGFAIYQDDIILGKVDKDGKIVSPRRVLSDGVGDLNRLWLGCNVPFEIDGGISGNPALNNTVNAAVALVDAQTTCNWFPRTSEGDWVRFIADVTDPRVGGSSDVGRQGGRQDIHLNPGTRTPAVISHEMTHAMGMWHEQSRPDRDSYVTYTRANLVDDSYNSNFDIEGGSTAIGVYDFDSVMHYPAGAFAKPGALTLQPNDPAIAIGRLGQRGRMSDGDSSGLAELYAQPDWNVFTRSQFVPISPRVYKSLMASSHDGNDDLYFVYDWSYAGSDSAPLVHTTLNNLMFGGPIDVGPVPPEALTDYREFPGHGRPAATQAPKIDGQRTDPTGQAVFARAASGTYYYYRFDFPTRTFALQAAQPPGRWVSNPAAVTLHDGTLLLFGRNVETPDRLSVTILSSGVSWSAPALVGFLTRAVDGDPSVISADGNSWTLAMRDATNIGLWIGQGDAAAAPARGFHLYLSPADGTAIPNFTQLSYSPELALTNISVPGNLLVLARGSDGTLYSLGLSSADLSIQNSWERLGGRIIDAPAAVGQWNSNTLWITASNSDDELYWLRAWQPVSLIPGGLSRRAPPVAPRR